MQTLYSAESSAKHPLSILASMGRGLVRGRYMAYRLFVRDVKGDYSRSMFGAVWDFAEPLVVALVFTALYNSGVINSGDISIPYPVYVVLGLLMWQTFTEATTYPLDIIRTSRGLITQLKVVPESLLLSVFLRVSFNSAFRIVIMVGITLAMQSFAPLGFVAFLLLFPVLIVAGMAFGVFLAPFNAIYADVGRVVRISLRPLLFATPVLWAVPRLEFFPHATTLNPAATVLSNLRSLATQNQFSDLPLFLVTAAVLGLILLAGWFIFHVSMPILAERA